jgi:hypothetical protein
MARRDVLGLAAEYANWNRAEAERRQGLQRRGAGSAPQRLVGAARTPLFEVTAGESYRLG